MNKAARALGLMVGVCLLASTFFFVSETIRGGDTPPRTGDVILDDWLNDINVLVYGDGGGFNYDNYANDTMEDWWDNYIDHLAHYEDLIDFSQQDLLDRLLQVYGYIDDTP